MRIPALGVSAEVVALGLRPDGTLDVPVGPDPVGWYEGSPPPGALGPSVLAGHVTWNDAQGVFARLATLAPGDVVDVTRADGSVARFAVDRVEQYAKDAFPSSEVYGPTQAAELRLITCAGDYVESQSRYLDNVVVYASLVGRG